MEVILIIGIIFVVLLFLPKKKEAQQFDDDTIDKISDMIWFDNNCIVAHIFTRLLNDILKTYDINKDEENFINTSFLNLNLSDYKKNIQNDKKLLVWVWILEELFPKIELLLSKEWINEVSLSDIALLSFMYQYFLSNSKLPNNNEIDNAKKCIISVYWNFNYSDNKLYIELASIYIAYTLEKMQEKFDTL